MVPRFRDIHAVPESLILADFRKETVLWRVEADHEFGDLLR